MRQACNLAPDFLHPPEVSQELVGLAPGVDLALILRQSARDLASGTTEFEILGFDDPDDGVIGIDGEHIGVTEGFERFCPFLAETPWQTG